ncbi:MAG TPA: hypothetical protein PKY82_25285 [Pyrinomonadaceae bacterium]|nr:hypothetical protein [Pyrinomonadaceae bacterium]
MSETGHAKNLSNFLKAISIVSGLGSAYDPNNPLIELTNLQTKLTALQTAFAAVVPLDSAETLAINERGAAFEPLPKLVTRISNAAAVNINDALFADNLRTIVRKLQGRRAPEKTVEETEPTNPVEPKQRNKTSQLGFDDRVANFFELITLLKTQGAYNPNETDLKIATLETMLLNMQAKNTAVVDATVAVQNARIVRNQVFYNKTDGVIVLANLIKKYVKSVFGATSPQFKQLTVLQFRNH